MSKVIIAHLSDLHCDGSRAWEEQFKAAINCLVKKNPISLLSDENIEC